MLESSPMELIASLREQVDRLCQDVSTHSNWILQQLSAGLRERYGRQYVGFARRSADGSEVQLIGLCGLEGEPLLQLGEDLSKAARRGLQSTLGDGAGPEYWFSASEFGDWDTPEVAQAFAQAKSAFIAPWLVDRPRDWLILILSPIAAPATHRQDRGLSVSANLLATNLLRALDAKRLEQANAWIEREMDEIAKLQQLLRPDPDLKMQGADIAFSSHIYQYAGGDYLDIPRLTHLIDESQRCAQADHWGAMIADVSGHGPSAAVEAAMIDAIMRTYTGPVAAGPEAVMDYLNQHLFTRKPRASFVTAFISAYFPDSRLLRFANAGHPSPMLRRQDGTSEVLPDPTDIPLRVERDYRWQGHELVLQRDDLLLLYTDGVTEARNPAGQELGQAGLQALLQRSRGTAADTLTSLRAGILAHRGGRDARDDETLIAIRIDH